jgi:hypothetical protein
MIDSSMFRKHALEMAPRFALVAEIMLRRAHHSFADQSIARVGPAYSQSMEPLSQCQTNAILTADRVKDA